MNVLFDTNVILDIVERRESFYEASNRAVNYAIDEKMTGFVSVQSLKEIFYLICKTQNENKASEVVGKLSVLFTPIGVLPDDSMAALMSGKKDYGGELINASANRSGIDIILTRKRNALSEPDLLFVSPEDLDRYLEPGATSGTAIIG